MRDFAVVFPRQLIFEAGWLKILIEIQVSNRDFRPNGPRNRLFRELANGFRRAANPKARINRAMRDAQMTAARFVLGDIRKDLSKWESTLKRSTATLEWIHRRATEKARELGAHPRLEPHQQQLEELLFQGQHYKASILVAAKTYRVRQRDLESRQS